MLEKLRVRRANQFKAIHEVVLRLILVMVLFSVTRLLFYLFNYTSFSTTSYAQLATIFLGGLRFDLTAVLYINSLYITVMLMPVNGRGHPVFRKIIDYLFFTTNAIALALNCIDIIYYRFTSTRTRVTVFEQFSGENNYLQLAYNMLVDYFYIVIIWLSLVALLIWVTKKIKVEIKTIDSTEAFLIQAFVFIVFIGLAIIGVRSGLPPKQDFPLAPSDAGQYVENPGDIVLVQNTPFTMMMSLNKPVYTRVTYYDSLTLERIYPVIKLPQDTAQFMPCNIVLIVVESLGREVVGAFNKNLDNGNYKGYTPFLDSLADHSYIFINSYANSRISIQGSPAVLASIPSLQGSFTMSNYSGNHINSLATELKKKGYHTSMFHGAPNGSLGLNAFAVQAGIEHYYGMNEYGNDDDYDGVWGIWDHLFLPYAINTMDSFRQPFLSEVFTVSSHHPYRIPADIKENIPEGKAEIHQSLGYADYSLREMFKTAKSKPWYKNTIFVITGDHSCTPYRPEYRTSVGTFTVPIIFFKPGEELVGEDTVVAQQIDIMPTLLSYLNYDQPYLAFGNDLFDPSTEKFAISYYGNAFQLVMGDWVLLYNLQKSVGLYNLRNDIQMRNNLVNTGLEIQSKMERKVKAIIQQFNNRMIDNKLRYME